MDIAALLTSAGINVGICIVLFGLYSVLRKQPSNRVVYFGRRLASVRLRSSDVFSIERFVPSPSWIVKAWETTEEEILSIGGLDALVFQRMLIFSIRVFSIAAIICLLLVLPMNYYGKDMEHKYIASESLHVFTIGNVKEGSRWLWAHCLALYIISCAACVLLYFEYKSITEMRLAHITKSSLNPGHFTILVRSVPWCPEESFNDTVKKFFTNYYPSSYLSHQMVYRRSIIRKLMLDAEKMCSLIIPVPVDRPSLRPCCLCGKTTASFKILASEAETAKDCISFADLNVATRENECAAAFVFFKTRCSAVVATQMLQSPNPMLWVTELAPEPHDVLWSKISIPYKQLWLRKIGTLLASIVFMFVFLIPVTFVQGLTQLDKLSKMFPFLRGLLKKKIMSQVLTGYLPSVILMLFLYSVPPVMMVFSSVEGPFSRSGRKKSAALKILYFTIWNVFFVNILSGSVINQLTVFTSVKEIPMQLAKAIPTQATFFMTYVLTSGWAGLACEVMQLFPLSCNMFKKFILRNGKDSSDDLMTFPYHTEVPRILLFGLIGFTCSVMAPLIIPILLVYFVLAYLVYRNQILNVYIPKYEGGGHFWPIFHNTTIFSLVLTQVIALGVFGIKESPIASGFIFPLVFFTLLFNEYCRQRFYPIFVKDPIQILIEMDRDDEQSGRMEEIHTQLRSAYCQFPITAHHFCESVLSSETHQLKSAKDPEEAKSGKEISEGSETWADVNFEKES
ncbi:CSC1-like protein RXW8 isoform X1 [Mercurialis annua]|uniref:CSC1-like protein RXW8 isoform X1 n=1 Tax=Mercurialis annua TaxID=3986 RepID=UPI00215E485C|nr:CSC1-like protein RXW8 isoform X1 [Mercurialis annua]